MGKKPFLFNKIAGVYGIFFNWQVGNYRSILNHIKEELDFSAYQSIIDIGCGTGALCRVLQEYGLEVTGLDPAEAMLAVAGKKSGKAEPEKPSIRFLHGDVLNGLPFGEKSLDIAITSYVAHGLMPDERQILYEEMKRVAKHAVVLLDYNEHRSLISDIAEWLEGGDYFNFIGSVRNELIRHFSNIKIINTGKRSAIYICKTD